MKELRARLVTLEGRDLAVPLGLAAAAFLTVAALWALNHC